MRYIASGLIWMLLLLGIGCQSPTEDRDADPDPDTTAATTVGLDSTHMADAVAAAEDLSALHGLIVARHGDAEAEHRFNGPSLDTPVNVKSVSKTILSALIGIAIDEGYLEGPDQPIAPFFEQYLTSNDDPRKRDITIGHLLAMKSGLERTSGSNYGAWVATNNWVRNALQRPLQSDPGTERRYSTGNTHLLSAIITQATDQSTWAFARSYLADPLGIRLPQWPTDPQGIYFGGNDMRVSPRGLVAFGEMYRNRGLVDSMQVVSNEWIQTSWTPRAESRWSGAGYGYGWFTDDIHGHPTYYGWGFGGQYLYVVPSLELTIAITSDPTGAGGRSHRRDVQHIVSDHIIPAAIKGHMVRSSDV